MEESSEPPAAAPAEEAAAPETPPAEVPADITEKEKEADPVPVAEPEETKGKTISDLKTPSELNPAVADEEPMEAESAGEAAPAPVPTETAETPAETVTAAPTVTPAE